MGGLDQADASVSGVMTAGLQGARPVGSLPHPLHDAAAASVAGRVYVIGGGEPSYSEIMAVDRAGRATVVGHLPAAASDVAAAVVGDTVYVVGGYTGIRALDTIVAWSGSGVARVVGRLPHPLRYGAVTAIGGRLVIAGGTTGEDATADVYAFDPATAHVAKIAVLPQTVTHAAAAALNGYVYVIGGRGAVQGTQRTAILAIDPRSGRVVHAGRLPTALSDAGAAALGNTILVAGGREAGGGLSDHIYVLTPTR